LKTILFDPFPAIGHISSFLRIADYLKDQGNQCVFFGLPTFAQRVINQGHKYEILDPFVVRSEQSQINEKGWFNFLLENMAGTRKKKLQREIKANKTSYDIAFGKINPDLIILDDQYSTKAFFYSVYDIPIVRLQTKVNPFKSKGIPPFQSHHIPSGKWSSILTTELHWLINRLKRKASSVRSNTLTMGVNSISFLQKAYESSGFTLEKNRCFATGINELPVIINSPRTFDFPRPLMANVYHFFRGSKANQEITDLRLLTIIEKKKISGNLIIYCSLGTVTSKYSKVCTTFFNKIIKAAHQLPQLQFVLSVGKDYDLTLLKDKPSNVSIFLKVEQKELLQKTDLMISHGGMNSVMECIQGTVPMIIYPLSTDWDQPGNGARMAFHKLGYCSRLRSTTVGKITKQLSHAINQLPMVRKNLKLFQQKIIGQSAIDMEQFNQLIDRQTAQNKNEIHTATA